MVQLVTAAQYNIVDTIYKKFVELRNTQEDLACVYEEKSSYEMAYLSRWCVLERILKIIDAEYRKERLYRQVCEWKEHLENPSSKQPKLISRNSFTLKETSTIPDIRGIEEHLDYELPNIKVIMNTKSENGSKKWRDKRNDIAHRAEQFGSRKKYNEYRDKILEGISEIEQVLNDKCN